MIDDHTHVNRVAISIVFMLIVLLTNIASSVGSRAAQEAASTAIAEKDNGLDIAYADAYTSGVKLLQVLMVLVSTFGSLETDSGRGSTSIAFIIVACFLSLWTPFYYVVVEGCRCPRFRKPEVSNETGSIRQSANIVSSVPWVVALRMR